MTNSTSLFVVQFPAGAPPTQVDDFPPKTPRSCEGALHIRPKSTKKITSHEAAHLRAKGIVFTKIKKVVPAPQASSAPSKTTTAKPIKKRKQSSSASSGSAG
jgi:hypothetical protein